MRGKGSSLSSGIIQQGITPAYAGKSRSTLILLHDFQDHPRLCGEKFNHLLGSCYADRITPAYAGKSNEISGMNASVEDHPRLCGEKADTRDLKSLS